MDEDGRNPLYPAITRNDDSIVRGVLNGADIAAIACPGALYIACPLGYKSIAQPSLWWRRKLFSY